MNPPAKNESAPLVPVSGIRTIEAFGVGVDILLQSTDTNGAFSLYRLNVRPGGGSPLHVHRRDDETFHVLNGNFEIRLGDRRLRASAG